MVSDKYFQRDRNYVHINNVHPQLLVGCVMLNIENNVSCFTTYSLLSCTSSVFTQLLFINRPSPKVKKGGVDIQYDLLRYRSNGVLNVKSHMKK